MQHTCIACDTSSSNRLSCVTTLLGAVVTCCVIFQCHVNSKPATQTKPYLTVTQSLILTDYSLDYHMPKTLID